MKSLSGKTLTAFGTTVGDHLAATNGCHTGAETMTTLADQPGRLISALHYGTPFIDTDMQAAQSHLS